MAEEIERLSLKQAEHLLEAVKFFRLHPDEKEWQGLDRRLFLFVLQRLTQLEPLEDESTLDYLLRSQNLLESIILGNQQAPSIPPNLDELVAAWEEFQEKQNAEEKPTLPEYPTIEEWIKNLKEKLIRRDVETAVEKTPASVANRQQAVETITQQLIKKPLIAPEELPAVIEQTNLPNVQQQTIITRLQDNLVPDYTPPIEARPVVIPVQQQVEEILSVYLDKEQVQEAGRRITVRLVQNTPRHTRQELQEISPEEITTAIANTINASLPEITDTISQYTELDPPDSRRLLTQLQIKGARPLLGASQVKEAIRQVKIQSGEIARPEIIPTVAGKIKQAVAVIRRDPTTLFRLTPAGSDISVGEAMRNIIEHRGINKDSVETITVLAQPIKSFTDFSRGTNLNNFQQYVQTARQQLSSPGLISSLKVRLSRLKAFQARQPGLLQTLENYYTQIRHPIKKRPTLSQRPPLIHQIIPKPISRGFSSLWQKTKQGLSQAPLFKNIFSFGKQKGLNFLKDQLGSLKVFGKKGLKKVLEKGVGEGAKKGIKAILKKFGASKLGAALGSVIPGLGNLAGLAIGFAFDIGKKTLGKFGSFIQRFSGGKTSGERQFRRLTGPIGKVVTSPTLIAFIGVFGAVLLVFLFTNQIIQIEGGALIYQSQGSFVGTDPSQIILPSFDLAELIRQAANDICVPEALLLAISHTEASGAWNYTAEEIELFSTPGWWEDADAATIRKGYCYNTCDDWGCSADVRGIMQFTDTTFALYTDELREILGREPHRCLIPDSIYAAALKIKNDSGTGPDECQNWSDETVREVARKYCGSCNSPNCPNYCATVLVYYDDYQNSLDIILEPPDNKSGQLAEQVAIIMQGCFDGTDNPEGYINPNTAEQAKTCINSSDLSDNEKTTLNNMIDAHISQYNSLQCVGFVRVIENLTGGRFPICGQAARQWGRENCWQGSDYTFLGSNIDLVQGGDIAVKPTSSPGHIGIVSKRVDQESGITRFRFTSAIGGLGGSYNGGNITIMKVPASYFTERGYVFIRRND